MPETRAWTEQGIEALITNQMKEHLELDYKEAAALARTDGKKREISKDVSAFANSAGGVIIYGVREDGHVPVELDAGCDPNEISKEWLEQVINSNIRPRVSGIRIDQVFLSFRPGRVAYVVTIPQSTLYPPHQASDHRYYKRFNFESCPMRYISSGVGS